MTVESEKSTVRPYAAHRPAGTAEVLSAVLVAGVAAVGVAGSGLEAAFDAAYHPAAIRRGLFVLLLVLLLVTRIARAEGRYTPAARLAELRSLSRNVLLLMYGVIAGQQAVELLKRSWHDGFFDLVRAQDFLQMPLAAADARLGPLSVEYAACALLALLAVRAVAALPPLSTWERSH